MSRFGLSSVCGAGMTAAQLASLVATLGGEVVDLRAGRGHGWETDGHDAFAERGVAVGHIGLSFSIGDPTDSPERIEEQARRYPGIPLRVFAAANLADRLDSELVAAQLDALVSGGRTRADIYLDTHQGYASIADLRTACARFGCGVVLDVEGLAVMGEDVEHAARALAFATRAVHVKGFALVPGSSSVTHLPMTFTDLTTVGTLRRILGDSVDVCVQSSAGTPAQDFSWMVRGWTGDQDDRPGSGTGSGPGAASRR